MRKFLISLASVGLLFALVVAPAASAKKGKAKKPDKTIVETVIAISGPSGFDNDSGDFDILREAVVATGLAGKLDGKRQLTVFAPPDQAFLDLTGASTEQEAFDGVAALGIPAVKKVLKYHISPGKRGAKQVVKKKRIPTLLKGERLKKRKGSTTFKDGADRKVEIIAPNAARASNGVIHVVGGVLLPFPLA
jgi:serralysin